MPSPARRPRLRSLVPLVLVLAAACERTEATAPITASEGTVTLNASGRWAYLSLDRGVEVVPADPLTSTEWDVAVNATSVMLNGGQAGPGGVVGACVCQNSAPGLTDAAVLALTAEGEAADFEAVGSTAIPPLAQFVSEALTPALSGWHTGSGAGAVPANRAWLVRLRDSVGYAAVRVAAIEGPTAATPGRVTLEIATQATSAATLGPARTLAVTVPATGAVRVDLATGATTTSATAWDLQLEGWAIRVNGGASGAGKAAVATTTTPFAQLTTAWAGAANAYRTDVYAGVFAQQPWYRYNLTGEHRIHPTYDVYLVRRGNTVHKLQITNYYGPAGETRQITVRHARIAG